MADPTTLWLAAPAAPGVPLTTRRLVEVKPVADRLLLTEHIGRIEASGWDGPSAIVGAAPWDYTGTSGGGAELGVQRIVDGCRVGWGAWVMAPRDQAFKAWREAGNLTQWRGVGAVR